MAIIPLAYLERSMTFRLNAGVDFSSYGTIFIQDYICHIAGNRNNWYNKINTDTGQTGFPKRWIALIK